MHHGAATTICKKGEGEQGEVLGWMWEMGWEVGTGMEVATGREEKVTAGQRDTQMEVRREFEEGGLAGRHEKTPGGLTL